MILAIDSATETLGLALYDGRRIVAEEEAPAPARHTVELAPAVEELMRRAGIAASALTAVGVAQGPGSFTALRIGLAFAMGFAIPRNLPVIGVPTFDILVRAQPISKDALIPVVQAGRGRVAWSLWKAQKREWMAEGGAQVSRWEELVERAPRGARICGEMDRAGQTALEKRRDLKFAPAHLSLRRAGVLAELIAEKLYESKDHPPIPRLLYMHTLPAPAGEGKGDGGKS